MWGKSRLREIEEEDKQKSQMVGGVRRLCFCGGGKKINSCGGAAAILEKGREGAVSGGCPVPFCWRRREAVRLICTGKIRLIGAERANQKTRGEQSGGFG